MLPSRWLFILAVDRGLRGHYIWGLTDAGKMIDMAQRAQARDSRTEHYSSPLGLNGSSCHAGWASSGDAEGSVFKRRGQVCEDTEQQRA